ncbi:MAG: YibE/F family protein [Spirochaetaceae bacterium]|nr:YibE/F family protein [Spirochaetaceae bacterium]
MKIKISHVLYIIISTAVLIAASLQYPPLKNTLAAEKNGWNSYRGKVLEILDTSVEYYENGNGLKKTAILFSVKLYDGEFKGRTIKAVQMQDDFIALKSDAVKKGDSVIILQLNGDASPSLAENTPNQEIFDNPVFVFEEFYRFSSMMMLLFVFFVLLLIFGGIKGLNTLISLVLTCASLFCWFIPSIFNGANLYVSSISVCLYIIVMTVIIVNGINKKSLASIAGCFGGVLVAAALSIIMKNAMHINGYLNNDSLYLESLLPGGQKDLVAVLFSAIIIGAVGAVMDVSMSLSSALYELAESVKDISFKQLVKSGFAIGRDMMGTMANTLILAYIGSSLSFILVLIAYNSSFLGLLNNQIIAFEIMQALTGSIGILCGIPLTTFIASALYSIKIIVTVAE